jgi:hypothetical protein
MPSFPGVTRLVFIVLAAALVLPGSLVLEQGRTKVIPQANSHYWRLDEADRTYLFRDDHRGLHGLCAQCPAAVPGAVGVGQDFSAPAAGISVPASETLDWRPEQDFSIEAWVRMGECAADEAFVGRTSRTSTAAWWLGCRQGVAVFEADDGVGGSLVLAGRQEIANDHWHHIAVVHDSVVGDVRMFVDGRQDGRATFEFPRGLRLAGAPLTLGYLQDPISPRRFRGELDEVALRGQGMSHARVARHFNDGAGRGLGLGYDTCPATPVRIMPLGDSNTERRGYRRWLSLALRDEGFEKQFVGSRRDQCDGPCEHAAQHSGRSGWRPSDFLPVLPGWLRRSDPDVILMHVGTNELDLDSVAKILGIIRRHDPGIVVLLARIINQQVYHPETSAFNNAVAALAETRIGAGERIRIVDIESALSYPDDMDDLLHPNRSGFRKMSDAWLRELRTFLPACLETPPQFIGGPATDTPPGSPYLDYVTASGFPSSTFTLLEGPPGLRLNTDTGRLVWEEPLPGQHPVRILASNSLGQAETSLVLRVGDPARD